MHSAGGKAGHPFTYTLDLAIKFEIHDDITPEDVYTVSQLINVVIS